MWHAEGQINRRKLYLFAITLKFLGVGRNVAFKLRKPIERTMLIPSSRFFKCLKIFCVCYTVYLQFLYFLRRLNRDQKWIRGDNITERKLATNTRSLKDVGEMSKDKCLKEITETKTFIKILYINYQSDSCKGIF